MEDRADGRHFVQLVWAIHEQHVRFLSNSPQSTVSTGTPAPCPVLPRIWSPSLRVDVSDWLLSSGLAAEVKAERRPHPAGGEEELPGTADGYSFLYCNSRCSK